MSFFKKIFGKKESHESKENNKNNTIDKAHLENKVLKVLDTVNEDGKIIDDEFVIENINLRIKVHIANLNENFIQILFILNNENFDEEMVESTAGIGQSLDIMIQEAVAGFCFTTLCALKKALKDEEGTNIDVNYYDKKKNYTMYSSCLAVMGKKESENNIDYWSLLGEEISKRLGNKKSYIVKIYASKTEDSINCECRINGFKNEELTKYINEVASKWNIQTPLYSQKQFFVLIDKEAKKETNKISKELINEYIQKAIDEFSKCKTYEDLEDVDEKIYDVVKNDNRAFELICFVPQIMCELLYSQMDFSDELILLKENSQISMYKSQISICNHIYKKLAYMLSRDLIDEQTKTMILCYSSSFKAMSTAVSNGQDLSNTIISPLVLNVNEDYIPN
ncbi:DUF6348 family protein [Peptostreptococcaceae bacterium AGR-M142]